jgi:hypothetical protein
MLTDSGTITGSKRLQLLWHGDVIHKWYWISIIYGGNSFLK